MDKNYINLFSKIATFMNVAMNKLQKQAEIQDSVTKLAPKVAELLAQHGYISETEKRSAADNLTNPVKALLALQSIANTNDMSPPPTMGAPAAKMAESKADADAAFLAHLGL